MFEIVADEAGGVHDMTHAPCSREYYRWHTGQSEHANCHDNLRSAMDELAMTHRNVPTPVNLFQNTPMGADGWTENRAGVKIGRASCRERVKIKVVEGELEKKQ